MLKVRTCLKHSDEYFASVRTAAKTGVQLVAAERAKDGQIWRSRLTHVSFGVEACTSPSAGHGNGFVPFVARSQTR